MIETAKSGNSTQCLVLSVVERRRSNLRIVSREMSNYLGDAKNEKLSI
jgi:hypothetical protein